MRYVLNGSERKPRSPTLILALTCIAIFFASLDQTVIYGAIADMMPDFNLTVLELDRAAWMVIAYLIGFTFAMPLVARMSDAHGHKKIFLASLLVFLAGSIFVAISPTLEWVIVSRFLQAIGGGALVPIAMAMVGDGFPSGKRAIPLGIIGGVVEGGGALGPFYGGGIVEVLDWRWIFWINVPIMLAILVVLFIFMDKGRRPSVKVDYIGGLLLAAGLTSLSFVLSHRPEQLGSLAYTILFSLMAALWIGSFLFRELKTTEPLLDLSLFRNRPVSAAIITSFITGAALIIALVNIPLMSQTILGISPVESGLRLFRMTFMMGIGAVLGGYGCRFWGYRMPTVVGLLLSALGFYLFSTWNLGISEPYLTLHLVVTGIGFGLVIAPLASIVIDSVKGSIRAISSSLVVMLRMVGMIIGLAALSTWGMDHFQAMTVGLSIGDIVDSPDVVVNAAQQLFHDFFLIAMVICCIGIIPALWLRKQSRNLSPL